MGSTAASRLHVLGGEPAFEEHAAAGDRDARQRLRELMPDSSMAGPSGVSRALGRAFKMLGGHDSLDRVADAVLLLLIFGTNPPKLPFVLELVPPSKDGSPFEATLRYIPETMWDWDGLSQAAVVRLLADELGLAPVEVGLDESKLEWSTYPARGILRIPERIFRDPWPYGLIMRAVLKLINAHDDEEDRASVIEWANKLEG